MKRRALAYKRPVSGSNFYELSNYYYNSINEDGGLSPFSFFVRKDGQKIYILNRPDYTIHRYSLSTPYDLSTISSSEQNKSIGSGNVNMWFNNNGTKLFLYNFGNRDFTSYELSSAWDITSLTNVNSTNFISYSSFSFAINEDGTKVYTSNFSTCVIYSYSLSTPYDLSTINTTPVNTLDVSSQGSLLISTFFSDDGLHLYVGYYGTNTVKRYNLSIPFDISTASYAGDSLDLTSEMGGSNAFRQFQIIPEKGKSYACDYDNTNKIYEYTV